MKDVYGREMPPNPYSKNDTMKMLGKNYYTTALNQQTSSKLDDILEARPFSCTKDTAIDIFMLGYIHGKRAERARRKKTA